MMRFVKPERLLVLCSRNAGSRAVPDWPRVARARQKRPSNRSAFSLGRGSVTRSDCPFRSPAHARKCRSALPLPHPAIGGSAHPFAHLFDRALRTGLESADVHSNVTSPKGTRRTQQCSPGLIPKPCVAGSNPAGGAAAWASRRKSSSRNSRSTRQRPSTAPPSPAFEGTSLRSQRRAAAASPSWRVQCGMAVEMADHLGSLAELVPAPTSVSGAAGTMSSVAASSTSRPCSSMSTRSAIRTVRLR